MININVQLAGNICKGVALVASLAGGYFSTKVQENFISSKVAEEVTKQMNK